MKSNNSNQFVKLGLKDEHHGTGPLYKIDAKGNFENYENSDRKHSWDNKYFAKWFTPAQARKIAKQMNLPLEFN